MPRFVTFALILSVAGPAVLACAQSPQSGSPLTADQVFAANSNAIVQVKVTGTPRVPGSKPQRLGTGFLIHREGYIVTAAHVLGSSDDWQDDPNTGNLLRKLEVSWLRPGPSPNVKIEVLEGPTILYIDPQTDLALLRVACNDCPTVRLGDTRGTASGKKVHAVVWGDLSQPEARSGETGSPYSSKYGGLITLSALNLVEGSSGAPVFEDRKGNVIGIVIAGRKDLRGLAPGLAAIVPVNLATNLISMTWHAAAVEGALEVLSQVQTDAKMPLFPNVQAKVKEIETFLERIKQNVRLEPRLLKTPNVTLGTDQVVLNLHIQSDIEGYYLPLRIEGMIHPAWRLTLQGADRVKSDVPTSMTSSDSKANGLTVAVDAEKEAIQSAANKNTPLGFATDQPLKTKLKDKYKLSDGTLKTLTITSAEVELQWEMPNLTTPKRGYFPVAGP